LFNDGGTMGKINPSIVLIAIIGLAVTVSGCINSSEPNQKTQPIISPIPNPTKEVKP
jgi:hypothetical protein